jgi:hypothetical protein
MLRDLRQLDWGRPALEPVLTGGPSGRWRLVRHGVNRLPKVQFQIREKLENKSGGRLP